MISLITGPMKSGKSTELFRQMERKHIAGKKVLYICTQTDSREFFARNISRSKLFDIATCKVVSDWNNLKDKEIQDLVDSFDALFIDEYFMIANNVRLLKFFTKKEGHKCDIYFGGLLADANAKLWSEAIEILPYCDSIQHLNAVCEDCGSEHANFSYTAKNIKPGQIIVGDSVYKALCRKCYCRAIKKEIK